MLLDTNMTRDRYHILTLHKQYRYGFNYILTSFTFYLALVHYTKL